MSDDTKDDFDTAFAEVVAAIDNPTEPAPVTPPADPPADPPAPVTPPATPPVTPSVTPPADPPADPPAPETPPVTPPAPKPAAPAAAPVEPEALKETPEQKVAREAVEASIKPYEPTPEEVAALAQFKKDFPSEAVAVEARLKSVDRDINARVYKAVQSVLEQVAPRLATVEQGTTAAAMERHVTAIHTAHPDFDAVVAKVPAWIETLPAYAQVGAKAVYDSGTTQEVIALVADYKKANPVMTPAPTTPAPPAKPKAPDGADLLPTSSRRPVTTPKGTPDANDFDGAFAEAAAELG